MRLGIHTGSVYKGSSGGYSVYAESKQLYFECLWVIAEAQAASSPQHQRLDIDSSSGPVHTSSPTQPPSTMHSPSPAKEDALHHHGEEAAVM